MATPAPRLTFSKDEVAMDRAFLEGHPVTEPFQEPGLESARQNLLRQLEPQEISAFQRGIIEQRKVRFP